MVGFAARSVDPDSAHDGILTEARSAIELTDPRSRLQQPFGVRYGTIARANTPPFDLSPVAFRSRRHGTRRDAFKPLHFR